jgi:hypothetical protein
MSQARKHLTREGQNQDLCGSERRGEAARFKTDL